jgi:hypothetical protein
MKPIWVVLITVLATAVLVGGGTYYFLNQKLEKDKTSLQKQIDDLKEVTVTADTADAAIVDTTSAPVVDVTADWKNFTDNTHSLSFKYPATWGMKSSQDAKKNEEEMVYVDQSITVLSNGKTEENSNIGLTYTYITNISDYDKNIVAHNKDIDELLSVYNNKEVGANTAKENIWLPSSNAAIIATSSPEYIESKDGTFRGIVYFANIGQGFSTGLDCVIVMTNGKKIFQLHSSGGSVKSDYYKGIFSGDAVVSEKLIQEFFTYIKTLTSKNVEETVIKDYNDIYKNIALSLK